MLLAGYAPDFMGESVYEGLTVGYCLALSQFVMVLVLGVWYLRKADERVRPARREGGERAQWRPRRTTAVPPGSRRAPTTWPRSTEEERKA